MRRHSLVGRIWQQGLTPTKRRWGKLPAYLVSTVRALKGAGYHVPRPGIRRTPAEVREADLTKGWTGRKAQKGETPLPLAPCGEYAL